MDWGWDVVWVAFFRAVGLLRSPRGVGMDWGWDVVWAAPDGARTCSLRGRGPERTGRGRGAEGRGTRCWVAVDRIGEVSPLVEGGVDRPRWEGPESEVWLGLAAVVVVTHVGEVLAWGQQSRGWWVNGRVGVAICVVEEIPDLAVIQDQGLGRVAGVRTGGCSCPGGGFVYKWPGLARSASGRSLRPSVV